MAVLGRKVNKKKRTDYRWIAPDGAIWDSKFEYEVYESARLALLPVRRTRKGRPNSPDSDTFSYRHPVRSGSCGVCGSLEVGTARSYTADLLYSPNSFPAKHDDGEAETRPFEEYFVDAKGYLRASKRALLRSFIKERKDVNLRIILQRDYRISGTSYASGWIKKYLKIPYAVWKGNWPTAWVMP